MEPPRRPRARWQKYYDREISRAKLRAEIEEREGAPALPQLTDLQRAFVHHYVANGGNGERAAIKAGYSKESTARGSRAAAVAACRLLKRSDIQHAIGEAKTEQVRQARMRQIKSAIENVLRHRAEGHAGTSIDGVRVTENLIQAMIVAGATVGPQSNLARAFRRLHGQPVLRLPGHCRCGVPALSGMASCPSCRRERRDYRRWYRAKQAADRKAAREVGGYVRMQAMMERAARSGLRESSTMRRCSR